MRFQCLALVLFLGAGLVSCTRDTGASREGPDARQAGRDAYRASQAAKRDAKEVGRELQNAGRQFREGWNEARGEDKVHHKKD